MNCGNTLRARALAHVGAPRWGAEGTWNCPLFGAGSPVMPIVEATIFPGRVDVIEGQFASARNLARRPRRDQSVQPLVRWQAPRIVGEQPGKEHGMTAP